VKVPTADVSREDQAVSTGDLGLELFRLVALRPPKLALGSVPRIRLEPGEEQPVAPAIVDHCNRGTLVGIRTQRIEKQLRFGKTLLVPTTR